MHIDEYKRMVLESADEGGLLDPPALTNWFLRESLLIGMSMDGLIENRARRDAPCRWYITDSGRANLRSREHAEAPQ